MNRLVLVLAFLLSGCEYSYSLGKDKAAQIAADPVCFDIAPIEGVPNSPLLINKCTGDTWMLLYDALPLAKGQTVPGRKYGWYKIERWAVENLSAGH